MKILTILFLSICSLGFGQKKSVVASSNGITVTDDIRLQQLGLDRKIELSKGEQFTEKEWQEYYKQMAPYVKQFFKRDSAHQKFIQNTVTPYLMPGDSIQSINIKETEINLKLKPKKKK